MKKCLGLMLSIFVLFSMCMLPIPASANSFLYYPHWDHLEYTASSWYHVYDQSSADITIDGTEGNFHQGKSAMKVDNTSGSSFNIAALTSDFITQENMGDSYRCVFWVKTENLSADSLYFYPNYRTENERVLVPSGTADWTKYETTLLINEEFIIGEYVVAFVFQGAGIVWIDDVSIQKINGDGTYGANVLKNQYFERNDFYPGTMCYDTETVPYWTIQSTRASYDMDARIVSDVSHSGGNSLRITNNMGTVSYLYLKLFQPYATGDNVTRGVDYTYSFWIKTENQHKGDMHFGPTIDGGKTFYLNDLLCGTKDWQYVTGTWQPGWWGNFNFYIATGSSGTLWIDDVVVKKASDPEGTNNILNPGFESVAEGDMLRKDVSDIAIDASVNSAKISWTNPDDYRVAGTKIYKIKDGYKALLADVGKYESEYTVDSEGTYIITTYGKYAIPDVPENGYLNSPGVTVNVDFVDFDIDETFVKIDDTKSENLVAGTAKPCASVISKEATTVTLAMALYNGNKLVKCVCEDVNITGNGTVEEITTSSSLTIPELSSGNYSAKVFVFDNAGNMKPLLTSAAPILPVEPA